MGIVIPRHIHRPFLKHIVPAFAGKPTRYLEIGVAAGKTSAWMFQHVLTHPESTADLVDPWLPFINEHGDRVDPRANYRAARRRTRAFGKRCRIHRKSSALFFAQLPESARYDLVFIDGNHALDYVLSDATAVLRHVDNGIVVFDDTNQRAVRAAVRSLQLHGHGYDNVYYATSGQTAFRITKRCEPTIILTGMTRMDFPKLIDAMHIAKAVEVGVDHGWFSHHLLQHSQIDRLVSVDVWAGHHREPVMEHARQLLGCHGARSDIRQAGSIEQAGRFAAEGATFGFVYIDASHGYRSVRRDIAAWLPLVTRPGIIAGHDYISVPKCGVVPAVNELATKLGQPIMLTKEKWASWFFILGAEQ